MRFNKLLSASFEIFPLTYFLVTYQLLHCLTSILGCYHQTDSTVSRLQNILSNYLKGKDKFSTDLYSFGGRELKQNTKYYFIYSDQII